MADIRSLLRNELASRQATGSGASSARRTRKRKLDLGKLDDARKKSRAEEQHIEQEEAQWRGQSDEHEGIEVMALDTSITAEPLKGKEDQDQDQEEEDEEEKPDEEYTALPSEPSPHPTAPTQTELQPQSIDEDEWAAFEREVAAPTKMPTAPQPFSVMPGAAMISAAPLSAAELAEREKMDRETQRRNRDMEASFEKEDAARLLEEELDEMDQLEERVRRLKERREEIRRRRVGEGVGGRFVGGVEMVEREGLGEDVNTIEKAGSDDDEDEDEEDEDWDNWRFR
ncbi:uncharacterized protein PADG_08440 [Paracoccidioides brasiliensis Pb18]|uniref:Uncharacterized protein n=1 Tax=Paracoccidioides brasiliensis (strain Pb18) TaxID=502780 RepID=C1GMF4_PARBD|nr:uncharacterized protein PADG_08440 [Paracoccidioides brasiliensis Pb18]EEH43620.1 hypothetical protein PADG_08440 [Paracoccidioides brasiliensis Pb18]